MLTDADPSGFAHVALCMNCFLTAIIFVSPLIKDRVHVKREEVTEGVTIALFTVFVNLAPKDVEFLFPVQADVVGALGYPWMAIKND